jgi:hypothetical protein
MPEKKFKAKENDTLASLCLKGDVRDWSLTWSGENSALKGKGRRHPLILYKADQDKSVFNPPAVDLFDAKTDEVKAIKEEKKVSKPDKAAHAFTFGEPKVFLSLEALDENGNPIRKFKYTLKVGGRTVEGTHDKSSMDDARQGVIREKIQPNDTNGELILEYELAPSQEGQAPTQVVSRFHLSIGKLNPINEPAAPDDKCLTGVQARLNNLGYHCGRVDGILNNATKSALRAFQKDHDVQGATEGEPDAATQAKLEQIADRKSTASPTAAPQKSPAPPPSKTPPQKSPPPLPPKTPPQKSPPPLPPKTPPQKSPPPLPPKTPPSKPPPPKTPPPLPPKTPPSKPPPKAPPPKGGGPKPPGPKPLPPKPTKQK